MADDIIGATIKSVRSMTKAEMQAEGWDEPATVLVLSTGTKLYPSCDGEGNGPGEIFGTRRNGESFSLYPGREK